MFEEKKYQSVFRWHWLTTTVAVRRNMQNIFQALKFAFVNVTSLRSVPKHTYKKTKNIYFLPPHKSQIVDPVHLQKENWKRIISTQHYIVFNLSGCITILWFVLNSWSKNNKRKIYLKCCGVSLTVVFWNVYKKGKVFVCNICHGDLHRELYLLPTWWSPQISLS